MHALPLTSLFAAAFLAGCASSPLDPTATGKHLVYRDAAGKATRQFDYPDDSACRRVAAMAGSNAKCQTESAVAQLQAKATLRYNPPGMMVQGYYADMARCTTDTRALPAGVELLSACSVK